MQFTVTGEHAGQRLDVFLTGLLGQAESRSDVQRSIKSGLVSIDGRTVSRVSVKVGAGQIIRVTESVDDGADVIAPSNISLNVAYEDDDIAVIDKQVGMTVHPGAGHVDDTLANAAVYRCGGDSSNILMASCHFD